MKEAETSADGNITYLKKGAKVRLAAIGNSHVIVEELSEDAVTDGVWATYPDKLVTEEEYAALEAADTGVESEPPSFGVGDICIMKCPEVSGDGRITYLKKGARVRIEDFGRGSVLVQDLSDDMVGDGVWYTDPVKLIPIDKPTKAEETIYDAEAEATDKNRECVKSEECVAELEVKNKHYVSDHQPIETMQSNMTHDEMIGFLKGNIIKYACRCGKKDEPLKEAEKIKQYAEWLCIVLSGGTINPRS